MARTIVNLGAFDEFSKKTAAELIEEIQHASRHLGGVEAATVRLVVTRVYDEDLGRESLYPTVSMIVEGPK